MVGWEAVSGALTAPAAVQKVRHTLEVKNPIHKEMVAGGGQLRCLTLPAPACVVVGDAQRWGHPLPTAGGGGERSWRGLVGPVRALRACELTSELTLIWDLARVSSCPSQAVQSTARLVLQPGSSTSVPFRCSHSCLHAPRPHLFFSRSPPCSVLLWL